MGWSSPTCSPLSPGMPGAPGSPGSPAQSGLSPCGEWGHIRTRGWHCPLPTAHHPPPSPAKPPPPEHPPLPKAPTMRGRSWMPSRDHPWGAGGGTRTAAPLTRASSARGNCAKHWKKTRESPSCDRASLSSPRIPGEDARIPSGTSVPSACPQCPQSPSGARCFPQFPHNPIPRDSGAPLHLPPHCQGVSGTQIPTRSCGNTHPGTVLAARGTRHAPIPFLPLQSPRSFQGRLQLGTVPAESLGGKGESGAPRGVPRGRRVTPSPPSHLQHLDVPLGHDGQRSLEKREGGMEKRDGRMEGGRDGGRDCPRGGGAGQGTPPWELSPPTRSPAGPGSPGKPLCPGIP